MMISIVIIGTLMGGAIVTALVFIFRGYGKTTAMKTKHVVLIASLIAFVVLCCGILLALSYVAE